MKEQREKCQCARLMGRDETKPVRVHLFGCPEDGTREDYAKLPWYKRLFTTNPASIYLEHFPKC